MRPNPDTTEIESVSVPAREHRRVPDRQTVAMPLTCGDQELEFGWPEFERRIRERSGESRRARPMLGIMSIILASRIVQECEQLDDSHVRPRRLGQAETVLTDSSPMSGTVNSMPIQDELISNDPDELLVDHFLLPLTNGGSLAAARADCHAS
jgi:hypothetical protein